MTTVFPDEVRCGVCDVVNTIMVVGSTSSFGASDLDTRPPELARSTISSWVQRCEGCGHCASDLTKPRPQAASTVRETGYQRQLADETYPQLARSFLCQAMIEERAADLRAASWSIVHAAWASDDAREQAASDLCRGKALDMIHRASAAGQRIVDDVEVEAAMRVDLLRRAGRHDDALALIAERLPTVRTPVIAKILLFQRGLARKRDRAVYKVSDAPDSG